MHHPLMFIKGSIDVDFRSLWRFNKNREGGGETNCCWNKSKLILNKFSLRLQLGRTEGIFHSGPAGHDLAAPYLLLNVC